MIQQLEMLADASPSVNWDQELIKLLVEAVLVLPDREKKNVLDKAIAPLFEALLTMNKEKEVSGVGLIWIALVCSEHRDHARLLWPLKTTLSEEIAPSAPAASELKESPNVA